MKHRPFTTIVFMMLIVPTAFAQDSSQWTLERAVNAYINNNLEIQAARLQVERTRADQIAARLRPNPGLTIAAENLALSGPTPFSKLYEASATYSETIELGGKRQLRTNAAELSVSAAEAQLADTIRRGVAELKRSYLQALLARYDVDIAAENRQTFEQLVQFNLARFQQGAVPEADLIKVRLERIKFDSAVRQAELIYRQTVIRLLERAGESTFPEATITGSLDVKLLRPNLETLRQTAARERTDVLAAEQEIAAAKARLSVEQSRGRPDLIPYAGYKRVGDDNTVALGVSIPLKIRDRNEAGIARAEADIKAAQKQLQLIRNHAMAEVQVAYEAFQAAVTQAQTFRNEILNQAEESRSITLAAYQEGATALLPVLEAERTRAEVRQQYFRTLFDYQASLVDLELAVGKEIQP